MAALTPILTHHSNDLPRPAGGILINSDASPTAPPGGGYGRGRPPAISVIRSPSSEGSPTDTSPRIRFAPLPDPNRPRSLSTGRNLGTRASEGPNGEREYTLELRNMDNDDEHAVDDEEDSDSDGPYDHSGRRKSWVNMGGMGSKMTMGMNVGSWMGMSSNKKGKKEDESIGAPLKKTSSNGMLIPTSPFKLGGSDTSSKKLGSSPSSSFFGLGSDSGRRGSSAGLPQHRRTGSESGTSTPKVRMLNGRVYGARRASEAAAAEEVRRRRMEPEFVEWGSSQHRGAGSQALPSKTIDDDDGGGMAWVRKRREERERREREEREARGHEESLASDDVAANQTEADDEGRPASLSSSVSSSGVAPSGSIGPHTPHEPPGELVGTAYPPAIEVTPPMPRHPQPTLEGENDHDVRCISIPGERDKAGRRPTTDDEYEEGDDDGDFDDDDEDDDEDVGSRFTASAAGVEILSRHKK